MKIAIFASGNGSNFQAITEAIVSGQVKADLRLLFCDKKEAFVIQRAQQMQVPVYSFAPTDFETKTIYETALVQLLTEQQIDLIVLAGYMRIIGPTLLDVFAGRIINIHPSLLPDFPGLHGIQDAFEANVKETGVTIHYIDAGIDTGPIIAQAKVAITPEDTFKSLEEKIHQTEHQMYPEVLAQLIKTAQEESIQ